MLVWPRVSSQVATFTSREQVDDLFVKELVARPDVALKGLFAFSEVLPLPPLMHHLVPMQYTSTGAFTVSAPHTPGV